MTIAQICRLSREVERNELLTTVVLDRVYDERAREADGEFVLRVTYPTQPIKLLIQQVTEKLMGKTHKGGLVVRGSYGSGKSHTLLTLFHLCRNAQRANKWCQQRGLPFRFPDDVRVAATQLVGEMATSLWGDLLKRLGEEALINDIKRFPSREQWASLGRKQPTVLLIDELEAWYEGLSSQERPVQRNALQNLMEAAELDDVPLFVVVSVYGVNHEVMAILNRTQPPVLDVGTAEDRWKIVRHRLLDELDDKKSGEIVQRYLQTYKRVKASLPSLQDFDELRKEMERHYPFCPHFLRKVFEVYSLMPRHEMTRGVIGLCATLLRRWAKERDLILTGDLDVMEEEIASDLRKLDPMLVENAQKDLQERCREIDYAAEFLGAALLYSVGGQKGISEEELWLATLRPERNINDLQYALEETNKRARFLERQNGNFVVTVEESLEKRLEQDAQQLITTSEGRQKAAERLKEELRRTMGAEVTFYPDEPIQSGGISLRYVVALEPLRVDEKILRPLFPDNTIVLLAPLESVQKRITEDDDWLLPMARVLVCEELLKQRPKRQQDIRRFKGRFEEALEQLVKQNFAKWLRLSRTNELGEEPQFVVRTAQVALSKEQVDAKVQETFDLNAFKDAIAKVLRAQGKEQPKGSETAGLTIKQLREALRREIGFPILGAPTEQAFNNALKSMLEDQDEKTGIAMRVGRTIYGYEPNIVPMQPWQESWRLWLKEFGPEPPAPEDVKARVRAALQKAGQNGISVSNLRQEAQVKLQEAQRAVAELVRAGEAVLESGEERYPDDGHLPIDKVRNDAWVWSCEFAPPDDRKARQEMQRLVETAGGEGISWGEVKSRLESLGHSDQAIERALERLWKEQKQVIVVNAEGQIMEPTPISILPDTARLKPPTIYPPTGGPFPPEKASITLTVMPYRLPNSTDPWLGEIRDKLDADASIETVTHEIGLSLCPERLKQVAEVTEHCQVRWRFKVPASKEEVLRYCEDWAKGLPDSIPLTVTTKLEGHIKVRSKARSE